VFYIFYAKTNKTNQRFKYLLCKEKSMKSAKKGDLSLQTIAIVILVLLFIVVVGYIFRHQVGSLSDRIFNIGESAGQSAEDRIKCIENPLAPECLGEDESKETGSGETENK